MRNVEYITNGFGAPTNYNIPGPMGNQFATPFGDPYRVDGVGFSLGGVFSSIGNVLGGIGKVLAPALPGLAQVGVGSLLNKAPKTSASQQTSQSQFTQVTEQAQAQQVEKSNTAIYVAVGAAALIAAYFLLSKRRR
jgi:hypothetical protein